MKFITLLIVLIMTFLACANSVNTLNILKREVTYDDEAFKNNLSKECKEELEKSEYAECEPIITLTNYKNACSALNSEKCQNYFKDPLNYYPICKSNPVFNELYQPNILKSLIQLYDIYCQTNENNELCPYSLFALTKSGGNDALRDQCKSKKCTDSLLKVYKDMSIDQYASFENTTYATGNYNYEEITAMNDVISALESDDCKSQHVTSNTIAIKINTIPLISLSLLLLLIFH